MTFKISSLCYAMFENNGSVLRTMQAKRISLVRISLKVVIIRKQSWESGTLVYKHQFTEAASY